ncbi:hypothetical protein [Streptomyces capparidis]
MLLLKPDLLLPPTAWKSCSIKGCDDEAWTFWRAAADAGNLDAAFNLSVLLFKNGRIEEAEGLLRIIAEAGDLGAVFSLGVLLAESGRAREAKNVLQSAAEAGHPLAEGVLRSLRGAEDEGR